MSLKEKFNKEMVAQLKGELNLKNSMAVPRLQKIIINVGIGSYIRGGDKNFDNIINNIEQITGQKPVVTLARLSVSNFRLREGQPVGVVVTLRGERMYDFVERLVHITLPRVRDFRGITAKGFDKKGNFSLGVKEATIFPEVNQENLSKNHGLQMTFVTSAKNDTEGFALLKALGFPFKDEVKVKEKAKASH